MNCSIMVMETTSLESKTKGAILSSNSTHLAWLIWEMMTTATKFCQRGLPHPGARVRGGAWGALDPLSRNLLGVRREQNWECQISNLTFGEQHIDSAVKL